MDSAHQSNAPGFTYILTNDRLTVLYIGSTSDLGQNVLTEMAKASTAIHAISVKAQADYQRLLDLGPQLMKQILRWLKTGRVATNKIISLWKTAPKAISKGKVGKPVEFGRKWIVNCYRGGYVLVDAPAKMKIADQHCVKESLRIHNEVFSESPETYATAPNKSG